MDGRNAPIRGLWIRGGRYYAQLRVVENGVTKPKRVSLKAADGSPCSTVAEARKAMEKLKGQRDEGVLPSLRLSPKLADYVPVYLEGCRLRKRPQTWRKESYILRTWAESLGQIRLADIRKSHIIEFRDKRLASGANPRTVNLDIIGLRQLLKSARDADLIPSLPTDGLRPLRSSSPRRTLVSAADIDRLIAVCFEPRFDGRPLKNAQQLSDYLRLLRYSGAREKEALRLRWRDVDFDNGQLIIGADGDTKNHEARHVDFNADLIAHLLDMRGRRAPDSLFLFPSPQRGDRDEPAKTFRESMRLARAAAGLPTFGFHDLRHAFASAAVMAGIDFMTIARWLGHKDGGVLVGKVYGHLADEHRKLQAGKLKFGTPAPL